MENVRIAILSTTDELRAFMDNDAPESLHYYNDELHEYVEGSAYTFFFAASAKHEDSQYIVEGNKIAFIYRDKPYYLNIMKVVKDEYTIDVEAYGLSLELLNEQTGEYSAASAMSFEQYIDAFDFADILTLGINEVSDKRIKNEWTGTSTILARLFSLANVFDAEIEFVTELNDDYSLARLVMNIYQAYDEESGTQGIGEDRRDITLRYGINVEGITKTSDITELYTAIRPTGKDGLTIATLDKTEYDADGNVAYKSPSGNVNIYAVQACEQFPSNLLASTADRYICEVWSYDTDNVNTLYGQALARLKTQCVPKVTYKIDGYFDTDIGDTVQVTDEEYNPPLYLDARVTEQVRSFTDPTRNKTTFSNVVEKESQIDPELVARMQQLIAENKTYACVIATDNGTVFKNNEGTTTLTAIIRDGGADITDKFIMSWYKDGSHISDEKTVTISADDVNGKSVYRIEARDTGGILRASAEVTVINVSDGQDITGWADQFYLSTSQTSLSGGFWTYVQPEWSPGMYYWMRSEITWSDGRITYTEPYLAAGLNNANQTSYEAKQEAETMQTVINEISQSVDKKAEIWYQYEDPSLDWTGTEEVALVDHEGNTIVDHEGNTIVALWEKEKAMHEGDLWYDTNSGNQYIYQDGQWGPMEIPNDVFDMIDGKAQIFVSQPVPPYDVGDLWFNSATSDIMTCIQKRESGTYNAADWEKRNKYTDDTAVDNLDSELDQQGVFDRLTNNGQAQGVWKENDELYINGAYVEFLGATIGGWEVSTESLMSPSGTIVLDAAEAAIYTQNSNGNKGAVFHDEGIDFYSWYKDGRPIGQLADYIHAFYGEEMLMLDALIPLCLHNKIFLSDSPSEQGAFVEGVTVRDDVQLVGDLYIGFPSQSGKSGAKVSYDDSQKTLTLDAEHIDINGAVTSNQNNIVLGGTHKIKLNWNGSGLQLYVDEIYIGYVQTAK